MRWRTLALVLFAVAAVLAMHGIDASSTAAHAGATESSAMAGGPMANHEPAHGPSSGAVPHHLAMVCAAVLLAVAAIVALRRSARLPDVSDIVAASVAAVLAVVDAFGRPPPTRYAICVIRR